MFDDLDYKHFTITVIIFRLWNKYGNIHTNIKYVESIEFIKSIDWNQANILCPKLAGKSSLLHDLFIAVKARNEND